MFDLLTLVSTRLTTRLTGMTFDDPETKGVSAMRIYQMGLFAKRERPGQGQDFPYSVLRLMGGQEGPREGKLHVRIISGLWVNPDTDGDGDVDGDDNRLDRARAELEKLIGALRGMAADGNYAPYSLESMNWWIGDEDGQQPEIDQYFVTADLAFDAEPIFSNY